MEPNDGKPIHPDDDGSIDRIVARLVRWGTRASDGLARVEYDSEFARRRAVDALRTAFAKADVAFCEVDASEPDTSAAEAARAWMTRFRGAIWLNRLGNSISAPNSVACRQGCWRNCTRSVPDCLPPPGNARRPQTQRTEFVCGNLILGLNPTEEVGRKCIR